MRNMCRFLTIGWLRLLRNAIEHSLTSWGYHVLNKTLLGIYSKIEGRVRRTWKRTWVFGGKRRF